MHYLILAVVFWLLSGCVGGTPGNPAAPPAPIGEIPPSLQFPESLATEFDFSKATGAGTGGLQKFIVIGDDISEEIADTANNFQILAGLVDEILRPLNQLVIPRRDDVTQFEGLIILDDDLVNVKIDFQPFDENGDGAVEPCSGNTATLPICYRIWFNGKRALSGLFLTTVPTETTPGDGRFRGLSPVKLLGVIPFATSVTYDIRGEDNKQVEYFIATPKDFEGDGFQEPPKDEAEIKGTAHILFSQLGNEDESLKTILGTVSDEDQKEKHLGRWRENDDFWSGSRDLEGADQDFQAACARISSGLVVESQECVDRGIDVSGVEFLDFLEISDLSFPADFPVSPTF